MTRLGERGMLDVLEGPSKISRENSKRMIPEVIEMMIWLISKILSFAVLGHLKRAWKKTFYSINGINKM